MLVSHRPENNNTMFILGIICLVFSLGFLLFALYIVPFLLLDYAYDVPYVLSSIIASLHESYGYSIFSSKLIIWLLFVVPGLITGYISYRISHLLDEDKKV
jgi:hypothetical protein